MADRLPSFAGFCTFCNEVHSLAGEPAAEAARTLMEQLEKSRRLDFFQGATQSNTDWSTENLFGPAQGKMFGVLVCQDRGGTRHELKAFSGQYFGKWEAPGWAPPLFDVEKFWKLIDPVEKQIKALGREIEDLHNAPDKAARLMERRKNMSRELMKEVHGLYCLHNFRNRTFTLAEAAPQGGLPTGTGDCCAPKLLNDAAQKDLQPLGLAEFYWGGANTSGSRRHGQFYTACRDNCGPILGNLLCGLGGDPDE